MQNYLFFWNQHRAHFYIWAKLCHSPELNLLEKLEEFRGGGDAFLTLNWGDVTSITQGPRSAAKVHTEPDLRVTLDQCVGSEKFWRPNFDPRQVPASSDDLHHESLVGRQNHWFCLKTRLVLFERGVKLTGRPKENFEKEKNHRRLSALQEKRRKLKKKKRYHCLHCWKKRNTERRRKKTVSLSALLEKRMCQCLYC